MEESVRIKWGETEDDSQRHACSMEFNLLDAAYAESFTVWYNNERRGSLLNERHWQDATLLCGFLHVFYEATNLFSSSSRATTPIVVHQLVIIGDVFKKYKNHRRLAGAVNKMLEKFLKYFYPLPHLYAFAFLLDPRNRYKGLQQFLKVLTRQLGPDYVSLVDDHAAALQEAYSVYELRFGVTSDQAPTEKTSPTSASWRLVREDLQDEEESPSSVSPSGGTSHNELNVFLNTRFTDAGSENLDLVRWWRNHSGQFPVLSTLARDIFSIPVSTVSSESAFSMAGNILDPHRSRLTPKMVEILTLVKDWELARMRMQNRSNEQTPTLLNSLKSGRSSDVARPPPNQTSPSNFRHWHRSFYFFFLSYVKQLYFILFFHSLFI